MPRILILIALALLAVTAAGCGSKPTSSGVAQLSSATTTTSSSRSPAGGSPTSREDGIYKFSACMRSHGVPRFPDPTRSSGGGMNLSVSPASGLDPKSPQFQAAQKVCQKLLPNGGQPDAATQAKMQTQMLKFSACMRSHGLPNFPDPTFSNGGAQLSLGGGKGGALDPNSPVFQAAQKACQSIAPGGKGAPPISGNGGAKSSGSGPSTQLSIKP